MAEIVIPNTVIEGESRPVSAATSAEATFRTQLQRFVGQPDRRPASILPSAAELISQPAPEGPQQS